MLKFKTWAAGLLVALKPALINVFKKYATTQAFKLLAKSFLSKFVATNLGTWLVFQGLDILFTKSKPTVDAIFRKIYKIENVGKGKEKLKELGEANEKDDDSWIDVINGM